jgi:glycosyltransferase involved in cell wall biosynthesis
VGRRLRRAKLDELPELWNGMSCAGPSPEVRGRVNLEDPQMAEPRTHATLPLVTILMPVRNEAAFLERSLGSVLLQDYPSDRLEILVLDGISDDRTREIVRKLQAQHSNLALIDNPGRIVATGLNIGLKRARGTIIVRVDGHTEIASDYVSECVAALSRRRADNVGGRMTATGDGAFGSAVAIATSSPFGVGDAHFHYSDKEQWVDTVYLGAWPREVFERIGLFDEELVRDQDDEFNYRLRAAGGRILLVPSIRSLYTVRGSASRLWRQYFQYGYWKVRVLQKHFRQMKPRQFVPPIFVASLAALAIAAAASPLALGGLIAVSGLYFSVNIVASVAAARRRWRLLALVAISFAILHFAYGTGFLAGLFRFVRRWRDQATPAAMSRIKSMEGGP